MGFLFTVLYIVLALLSPADMFPVLGQGHIELLVVACALLFSAPALLDWNFFRMPQVYLLSGLVVAVFLSVAFGENWMGGGIIALQTFLPSAIIFYLLVIHCGSLRRLRVLLWPLIAIAALYVVWGAIAASTANINACMSTYKEDVQRKTSNKTQDIQARNTSPQTCSPLLKVFPADDGTMIFRIRGLGILKDPNDLAQFLVLLLPFLWIHWMPGRLLMNAARVILPSAILIWGLYLTHSRGAVIALAVVLFLALRRRVNPGLAATGGALVFLVLLVLDFSGGRGISAQSGADRLELWSEGLEMFKGSPIFGVGFQNFPDQAGGHTAHNSFVLCLAELGIFGYACWTGLIVFTVSGLNALIAFLSRPRELTASRSLAASKNEPPIDDEGVELERWARALRDSLIGFLAAAFFLSRAFAFTLFLPLGMAAALLYFTSTEKEPISRKPAMRLLFQSAGVGFAVIALVYVCLRFRSLLGS